MDLNTVGSIFTDILKGVLFAGLSDSEGLLDLGSRLKGRSGERSGYRTFSASIAKILTQGRVEPKDQLSARASDSHQYQKSGARASLSLGWTATNHNDGV